MSCDRNGGKVSKLCALRSGVSAAGSRAAGVIGATVASSQRRIGQASGAILTVANAIEGPKSLDSLSSLAVVGAIAADIQAGRQQDPLLEFLEAETELGNTRSHKRPPNWRNQMLNTVGALKLAQAGSGSLGTAIVRLSRPNGEVVSQRNYFGGRVVLRAWNSRLSTALNARDSLPGLKVKSSAGRIYEHQGQAWHCGVIIANTSAGERAVTHLQSLKLPGAHYYFSRSLQDQEIAGIVSGHKEFEPKHLPGYAGEIGQVESLLPGLARAKRGLIRNYLLWGDLK